MIDLSKIIKISKKHWFISLVLVSYQIRTILFFVGVYFDIWISPQGCTPEVSIVLNTPSIVDFFLWFFAAMLGTMVHAPLVFVLHNIARIISSDGVSSCAKFLLLYPLLTSSGQDDIFASYDFYLFIVLFVLTIFYDILIMFLLAKLDEWKCKIDF